MENSDAIALDFETHYSKQYSLKKLTAHQYVTDPRFDPYLVALCGAGVRFCGPPADAPWDRIAGKVWVAHNAAFDSLVHARAVELGLIPAWAQPSAWHCTADLAVYRQAPRNLEGAAKVILGKTLDKDVRKDMRERRWNELFPLEREMFTTYAQGDADACYQIWEAEARHWPAEERALSAQTRRIGARGVAIDRERVEAGLNLLKHQLCAAVREIPWADTDARTLSTKALADACRLAGIPIPSSTADGDAACEAWEERYGEQYPWVRAMRTYRKANKALKALETIRDRTRDDGIMPFALKYCGAAATGRWSGDSGLNLQNLPREESFGVKIRECFVPRPGQKFVIADLKQIEPIVLAWLIGDEPFLAHVRAGRDTYEAHARASMGYSDPRPLKEVDKKLRALAKARVLGLGYGASAEPFVAIAKQMAGLELDPIEAKRSVLEFRRSNPRIIELWNRLDRAFKASRNGDYVLELPSGRDIRYFEVNPRGWTAAVTRGDAPRRFWGSKLVENLVQGVARDVFADCLLRLEASGFQIVWHVHDEAIVEVDASDHEALGEITRIMSTAPAWAPGLPVAAEAIESDRYTK